MILESPWPFSLAGKWPERKAKAILLALEGYAEQRGLKLYLIDITTQNSGFREYNIGVKCRKHDCHIPLDTVCAKCARESSR